MVVGLNKDILDIIICRYLCQIITPSICSTLWPWLLDYWLCILFFCLKVGYFDFVKNILNKIGEERFIARRPSNAFPSFSLSDACRTDLWVNPQFLFKIMNICNAMGWQIPIEIHYRIFTLEPYLKKKTNVTCILGSLKTPKYILSLKPTLWQKKCWKDQENTLSRGCSIKCFWNQQVKHL